MELENRDLAVAIETHGCKLNQSDSLSIASSFLNAGFRIVPVSDPFDVYLLNTCTVTHVADRKARRSLRSARKHNPGATIIAAGCYPERSRASLEKLSEVDVIIGRDYPVDLPRTLIEQLRHSPEDTKLERQEIKPDSSAIRTRAMVKIQEGCNQVCAFCIVPKVRGRERSMDPGVILSRINSHHKAGFKEAVLTGTQLGTYGFDLPDMDLTSLLQRILDGTDIPRLRVSSLQPQEIDHRLLEQWDDSRLCAHFHVALQSGSNNVLKRMRRKYTAREYVDAIESIRRAIPSASITTDVIVGFPGETDDDFRETYRVCDDLGFSSMHVFPYSSRPGTSGAHFKDHVDPVTKSTRMKELLELAGKNEETYRDMLLGSVRSVLWEGFKEGLWQGLTDNYVRVVTRHETDLTNQINNARLLNRDGNVVVSEIVA